MTRPRRHAVGKMRAGAIVAACTLVACAAGAAVYGVNAHVPPPELLDLIAGAGVRWVRIDFRWSEVEPEPDRFAWSQYDTLVDAALARGLRIYATIAETPAWATAGPAGSGVPRRSADWYDVCWRAASRYRGRIDHWGMWNEPNISRYWVGSRGEYIDAILKVGAQAVHAASPQAKVCGPELAHLESAAWDAWLEAVLERAGEVLDVVTHHVYPDATSSRSVIDRLTNDGRYPWERPSVRAVLQRTGWFGRPFWLTETGCASAGAGGEEAQRIFVAGLLAGLFGPTRAVSWVHAAFFYEASDDPRFPGAFGLLGPSPSYRRKPAFSELRRSIAELAVDDAEVIRIAMPDWLPPGAAAHGAVTVRNTGTTTWSTAAGYRLAARGGQDRLAAACPDLEAWEEVPPGGEREFVLALVAPEGASTAGERLLTEWQMIREGRWRFGEIAAATVTAGGEPRAAMSFLPFVASFAEPDGREWSSELVLHNRGVVARSCTITLLTAGAGNAFARALTYSVAPGSTTVLADVIAGAFGVRGRGALRLEADSDELQAGVITRARSGSGVWAAFSAPSAATTAIAAGGEGRLLRLARGGRAGTVSDLVLLNPGSRVVAVAVDLLDSAGALLDSREFALAPFEQIYAEDVLGEVGVPEIAHGQAVVRPAAGGDAVHAWAVTRSAFRGDPAVLEPAAPTGEPFVLAPVDASPRLRGGSWRTDLHLVAVGGQPAAVSVALLAPAGDPASGRQVELVVPETGLVLDDALGSWFDYRGAGALLVTPRSGAVASAAGVSLARVAVPLGSPVPAVPLGRALGDGSQCRLFPIVRGNMASGPRTHIGLANAGEAEAAYEVTVCDRSGRARRRLTGRLAWREWRQLPDVLRDLVTLGGQSCYAVVRAATPGGRLIAYATVVEGSSGDPIYVPCS